MRRLLLLTLLAGIAFPATAAAAPTLRGIAEVTGGSRWEQWVESNPNSYHLTGCSPVAPMVRLAFNHPPAADFRVHWAAFGYNPRLVRFAPLVPTGSVPVTAFTGDTLPLWLLMSHTQSLGGTGDLQLPFLFGTGPGSVKFIVGVWGSDDPSGKYRAFLHPRTFTASGTAQPSGTCAAAGLADYFLL